MKGLRRWLGLEKHSKFVQDYFEASNMRSSGYLSAVLIRGALGEFRGKGYALWLDDFGSGYSSLNVLKDYSFDLMKIDMRFLSDFRENPAARPILKGIVALAKDIGLQTLTEGVEDEATLGFLRSIGCDRLQGYLFGRPMPREQLEAKLRAGEYAVRTA